MKKNLFFIAILGITSFSVLFNSCTKDNTNKKQEINSLSDQEFSDKLVAFRNEMVSKQKAATNSEINFSEAIELIEATLNYYHGYMNEDYLSRRTDTILMKVDYNCLDDIKLSELQGIFIELNNLLAEKYVSLVTPNNRTISFDVQFEATSTEYKLLVLMITGCLDTHKSVTPVSSFGPTDYWTPGSITDEYELATGKCGVYVSQYIGESDATFEQEKMLIKNRASTAEIIGGSLKIYYFANLQTVDLYDSNGLFEGWDYECITPTEMNLHYTTISNKINYWYNYYNISTLKQFANINIRNDFTVGSGSNYLKTYVDWIQYGEKRLRVIHTLPTTISTLQ